jgi:methylglyoxal/glyoxal reductase
MSVSPFPSTRKHGLHQTFSSTSEGLKTGVPLSHGGVLPWLGLGVYQLGSNAETAKVVRTAIQQGYRSIDTAAVYGNERGVGEAIATCGIPREQIFVTTKVWNDDMRRDRVSAAFDKSLDQLGLEYVDLYLLHWPIDGKIVRSWRALEAIQRSGRARAIGVSNYMTTHLDELLAAAEIVPAVNQVEFHPYLQSKPLQTYCRSHGIQLQAWSPLMQGGAVLQDAKLKKIAQRHDKTVAQVVLRWDLQTGVVTIPKTGQAARLIENANVFDFSLSPAEMKAIDSLERHERSGPDPFKFNF